MFEVQETRMAMIRGQRSERNRTDDAVGFSTGRILLNRGGLTTDDREGH